jgi:hypothetical protein
VEGWRGGQKENEIRKMEETAWWFFIWLFELVVSPKELI